MSIYVKPLIRLIIAWVLCLAALAGFHFSLVAPRGRALADCRQQATDRTQRFNLLTEAKSPRGQERLREQQEELERRYTDFVFGSEEFNGLDFKIRDLAERNGLQGFSARHVTTTTKIGTTELKRIAQRNLVFSFTGGFPEFLRFLNELERNQPVVLVDQFTVQAAFGKQAGLSCTMECAVLYQKTGP